MPSTAERDHHIEQGAGAVYAPQHKGDDGEDDGLPLGLQVGLLRGRRGRVRGGGLDRGPALQLGTFFKKKEPRHDDLRGRSHRILRSTGVRRAGGFFTKRLYQAIASTIVPPPVLKAYNRARINVQLFQTVKHCLGRRRGSDSKPRGAR